MVTEEIKSSQKAVSVTLEGAGNFSLSGVK